MTCKIACTGPLPKMMPPSLEVLNLGDKYDNTNEFTGGIPAEWGSLTNLKELKMIACGLDGASRAGCAIRPRRSQSRRKPKFAYMNDNHLVLVLAQALYRLNSASSRTCRTSS